MLWRVAVRRRPIFLPQSGRLRTECLGARSESRAASLLRPSVSAHFKATRRRLPVRAVLFNRNADDFREQRLDD
jgi:hypothetical protein